MVEPSDNLRLGRRGLEEVSGLCILEDLQWEPNKKCFYLRFSVSVSSISPFVPALSEWYMTIDPAYPYGNIGIFPSVYNSICSTFPHQSNNSRIDSNGLWRSGKLCVEFDSISLGIHAFDREPITAEDRLYWYGKRAVLWVQSAADNALVSRGDFFELPDYSVPAKLLFVYNEDPVSLMQWEDCDEKTGLAQVCIKKNSSDLTIIYVTSFRTKSNEAIYLPCWGNRNFLSENNSAEESALWIRLSSPPLLDPWQAPMTFFELQKACGSQGIDLYAVIKEAAPKLRDGKPHLLLFGFPVPKKLGEEPVEMLWQALYLPTLSYKKSVNPKFQSGKKKSSPGKLLGVPAGFRPGELGWWQNDLQEVLTPNTALLWVKSENWSGRRIIARGQLPREICKRRIAMIGCGSLGSTLSELLVRGGVTKILCIDDDNVFQGNLCRHTLTMQSLFQHKSSSLAKRLSEISPHIQAEAYETTFCFDSYNHPSPDISSYDTIIETTGSDLVLAQLAKLANKKKLIVSASVGLGAKRIYLCMFKKAHPNISFFNELISPYLIKDQNDCATLVPDLPRDGIGCWHPLFPATASDMWMAAGTVQKAMERFVACREHDSLVMVYEAQFVDQMFAGFRPVEVNYDNL